jgi:hypothetical protein
VVTLVVTTGRRSWSSWAAGLYASEAAVELLIAHRVWLTRQDFLTDLVDAVDDGWGPRGTIVPMASVNWERVEGFVSGSDFYAASSELAILRLAASIAGSTVPASLQDLTGGLDATNAGFVLEAIAHRWGWHERQLSRTVTGRFTFPAPPHPRMSA